MPSVEYLGWDGQRRRYVYQELHSILAILKNYDKSYGYLTFLHSAFGQKRGTGGYKTAKEQDEKLSDALVKMGFQ
ncbi:hypothetical protein LMG19089_03863 [Ralstonia edaphis]|uniref:hypothetical protein n=1 Tax=Ralstonia edaphi TaxID=3058599 RepID=UPI0028F64063|nr:hypothetical protein [Ralstonia sp. LMG 6871]CAJ0705526.1 hypothetical protein LMG19089_03863 [Ralstonia sp. LMG 6871]